MAGRACVGEKNECEKRAIEVAAQLKGREVM